MKFILLVNYCFKNVWCRNSCDSNTQYPAIINNIFESGEKYYFEVTYDDG